MHFRLRCYQTPNRRADSERKREPAAKSRRDWRLDATRVVISAFLAGAGIRGAAGTVAGYFIGRSH